METVCVIECDFKTTMPVNGTCVPCTTSPCANHCVQKNIFGNVFPVMTSKTAKKFKDCFYYSGAIYISKDSFNPKRDPLKLEDLWNLHNLREIVGYIYIDLGGKDIPLQNLTFLENLYKVTTEFSGGLSLQSSLTIHDATNLEFLGMKSLRYMDFSAILNGLPTMCYTSALEKVLPIRRQKVKDPSQCEKEGHICHSECLPEAGCWGPGPAMCARCCTYEADGVCVADCADAPGFYLPPNISISIHSGFRCPTLALTPEQVEVMSNEEVMALMKPAPKCARCHEECMETCTGPEASQCIGECKNFKSGEKCVRRCSQDQYTEDNICRPCSQKCLPPLKSELIPDGVSACSGPGEFLGLGGCTFCHFVQKASSKYQCLSTRCPPHHFGNSTYLKHLKLEKDELSMDNTQVANIAFQECIPCHPECEICAGPGNHISVCQKCKNWMYRSECVNTCPLDDTYMPDSSIIDQLSEEEKNKLEKRECLRCHEQCSGGCTAFGPEFCKNCRYAKIMTDDNKFICNSTCPPELYRVENTNLCLNEKQYKDLVGDNATKARNQALIAAGIVLLFLLIFSFVFTILCFNYKAKRSRIKEALKSTYTNIKAPDMKVSATSPVSTELMGNTASGAVTIKDHEGDAKSSREPNMGRWEMINIDDLSFDENKTLIGKGAFGEVYRGKWRVPKRVLNQFNLARGTSLDVAIKVIRSSGSGSSQGGPATNPGASASESSSDASQVDANTIDRITARSNLQDMLAEAKVMASVQHKNCLPLIGVCLTRKMQCMVSMFVEEGSLDRYLRLHKDDLNSFTLLSWAEQIADGMAYLEERGIIHRDLAARNVLVQSREHVQITDFGLAKMLENSDEDSVVVRTGRVPIRWLAIETLQSGIYSHKTDVWSYGVTLWEIFTFGKQPYENIATTDIKDHVMKGARLSQPEICTLDTYMVMVRCWMEEQESRPTFLELMKCFHKYCQTPGRYLYIEGDEYAITRTTPYTPSPAPWTELKPLLGANRGIPDGVPSRNGGSGYTFRFPEEPFFDDHHALRTGENGGIPESDAMLPRRVDPLLRRFFSHSSEARMRVNTPLVGRQDRIVTENTSLASTNLDSWGNGSRVPSNFAHISQALEGNSQQPKYYNTSAFLGSGTYGPLVRPPSPPPPLAEAEHDDDLDNATYLENRGAEVNYLLTLGNSTETGEQATAETHLDDYLEPRTNDNKAERTFDECAVGNPDYFQTNLDYLQPTNPTA
ncbi:unnamed protein product [Rodentolepis nana]|uniref:Protein kinase domain-containing protein n=1 Tax=Rodentolepis nana TaxID=102285 RepID=A0A158QGH7_RODNA|nr:unnamed protein product [Rodentolepis nana]